MIQMIHSPKTNESKKNQKYHDVFLRFILHYKLLPFTLMSFSMLAPQNYRSMCDCHSVCKNLYNKKNLAETKMYAGKT